jgi:hypothetical protein
MIGCVVNFVMVGCTVITIIFVCYVNLRVIQCSFLVFSVVVDRQKLWW